jgi:hypothetical protein
MSEKKRDKQEMQGRNRKAGRGRRKSRPTAAAGYVTRGMSEK